MTDFAFRDEQNVLVDVKFHDIQANVVPCLPGWHTDGSLFEVENASLEKYLLYISGEVCPTEFCLDPLIYPQERASRQTMKNYQAKNTISLPFDSFVQYDSTAMHRGTKSTKAGHRLLIRVMSSNIIRGSNFNQAVYKPFNGKTT